MLENPSWKEFFEIVAFHMLHIKGIKYQNLFLQLYFHISFDNHGETEKITRKWVKSDMRNLSFPFELLAEAFSQVCRTILE